MKNFININNVKDYQGLIKESLEIKNNPYSLKKIGFQIFIHTKNLVLKLQFVVQNH